jgi:hypothetical protein
MAAILLFAALLTLSYSSSPALDDLSSQKVSESDYSWLNKGDVASAAGGAPIMHELGNATIRAELGRATWRLLHTIAARYPKRPKSDERQAAKSFLYLLSRLYPCGQCAKHFQLLLGSLPPDVSSREAFSQWACKAHNVVNHRLDKPQFNCTTVNEVWKCGCANDKDPTIQKELEQQEVEQAERLKNFDPIQGKVIH